MDSTKVSNLLRVVFGAVSLWAGVAWGQNTLDGIGLTAANPATVAYSLRRLSSTYAGPAIQVRRSSDNSTQDIGFTAGGDLNQAALLAFVGTANGFVSIWYDQSGNGRNLTASATNRQPGIVTAGVVNVRNARPSLVFDGANDQLINTSFPTTGFAGFSASVLSSWTTVGSTIGNIQVLLDNNHTNS